jgi:hypothetical protein
MAANALFDDDDDADDGGLFGRTGQGSLPSSGLLGQSVDDSDMALMQEAGAKDGHARHSRSRANHASGSERDGGYSVSQSLASDEAREIDLSDTTADDHQGDMDNFFDLNTTTSPLRREAPLPLTQPAKAADVVVPAAAIRQRFRPKSEWDAIDDVGAWVGRGALQAMPAWNFVSPDHGPHLITASSLRLALAGGPASAALA